MGQSCDHLHASWEQSINSEQKDISTIFAKGKRSILSLVQKFGDICITTYRDSTHQGKLANHDTSGIWVGYVEGHPTNTYWVFNPKTKNILTSNVTFLQKSYGDYSKVENPVLVIMSYDRSDDEEELKTVPIISKINNSSN